MTTFLKKISCGSGFAIEFPSEVKLRFGISDMAYISFVVSKRETGREVIFEKGMPAGNPYETWRLEISIAELNCDLENQIFSNNSIYDYRIAVYEDGIGGKNKFYIECYLLTNDIFSFENAAYKAVALYYAPGYYIGDSDDGIQSVRIPFSNYHEDLVVNSGFLSAANAKMFGYDYVVEEHGGVEYLVFKSGIYGFVYDDNTDTWKVPQSQLQNGEWNYQAEINSPWEFSTHFGWVSDFVMNSEMGVAMHSYRRGFSYETDPSASGWTFGETQSSNFNYETGIIAETSDGLTGGPTQRLSELQNGIRTTNDPNWEIFKSRYYDRYNLRGFQLNGVERIIGESSYSLSAIGSSIVSMDSNLNLFIQEVELDVGSSSGIDNHISKDDILNWTAVVDAQSRNISVDWTVPDGYTAYWPYERVFVSDYTYSSSFLSSTDFQPFSFDLDVPVGFGESGYFKNSSWMNYDSSNHDWYVDNPEFTPIDKPWALPKLFLESSGTYWVLAGFTRGGSTQFIQEGDVSGNIIDIANEPNHYLWNVGNVYEENYDTNGENVLVNNLDGDGAIKPLWGRAQTIELTFSFDSSESSSEFPSYSSSTSSEESSETSSEESSSSWDENWATEGYLIGKLQDFVSYLGQIGKASIPQNIAGVGDIVSSLNIIMDNVVGLSSQPSSSPTESSGNAITVEQARNSFGDIESRFSNVADMAYAYGSGAGAVYDSIMDFPPALSNLNSALIESHSESPSISRGAGEIAFKSDVDSMFEMELSKYVGIAESVSVLKNDFNSETSLGLVALGEYLVRLSDAIKDVGIPMSLEISRNMFRTFNNDIVDSDVENNIELDNKLVSRDIEHKVRLRQGFSLGTMTWAWIVDWGSEVLEPRFRYESLNPYMGDFDKTYSEIAGRKTIKLIIPTFVNISQAAHLNWMLNWFSLYNNLSYSEMGASVSNVELNIDAYEIPYKIIGLESIVSYSESIGIAKMENGELKKFVSGQKVVPSTTPWAYYPGRIEQQGWHFSNLYELNLTHSALRFDTVRDSSQYKHLAYIGNNVRRTQPFPVWRNIWVLAGTGTKIVLGLGATEFMGMTGFPFGAQTKHYFKCTKPTDSGYILYDGTQWIIWQSNIPEDYFGPIPNWPDDVIDANDYYLNLTYNSTMDHGVLGKIPDWNNVETADRTYMVEGNDESPIWGNNPQYNNPSGQNRDTSSVYGSIPSWKNVVSAESTYYGQGFIDSVWDVGIPFSEIMPSSVAHDVNTVKGTSFALRAYFTSEWGGILEDIDSQSQNGLYFVLNVNNDSVDSIGGLIRAYWSTNGISVPAVAEICCYGGGFGTSEIIYFKKLDHTYKCLLYIPKNYEYDLMNYGIWIESVRGSIETIVGCYDFSKILYINAIKSSVRRVNVTSYNNDISGFEGFTNLKIVEIIPGTTTSGQHILDNCFKNCVKLENVILPNCTSVGDNAFYGCGHVSLIKLGMISSFGANCFTGIGADLVEA